jgi:hypothetical protein
MLSKTFHTLLLLFCLSLVNHLAAQKFSQSLQIGAQYGPTPFETIGGLGASAGYEMDLGRSFSVAAVAGFVRGGWTARGGSRGQDASGSWDNQYSYRTSEQFNYLDITGLINLTPNSKRNRLEIGLGAGMTHTMLRYPKDLYINKGMIENLNYTRHHEWVAMAHLTIANRVKISDQLEVFGRLTGRQAFQESPVLERVGRFNQGSFSSSNSVKNNYTLSVGIGYFLARNSENKE